MGCDTFSVQSSVELSKGGKGGGHSVATGCTALAAGSTVLYCMFFQDCHLDIVDHIIVEIQDI